MPRVDVRSVEVTLASGKVLHFLAGEGDTIVFSEVLTQPTGTPASHPEQIRYYSLLLKHAPVDKVQKDVL